MAKKGQGALEYLMTYGWALLVIVIAVVALYALGILNPATYQQNKCSGLQHFTFNDQKLTAAQYIIDLRNGGTRNIAITSIKVGSGAVDNAPTVAPATISAGTSFTITTSNVPAGLTAGSTFPSGMQVVITYSITGGIPGQSDTGLCTGLVQ